MEDSFLFQHTKIQTQQILDSGTTTVLDSGGFLLTDIIINSTSSGHVTLLANDGKNKHIIAVLNGKNDRFNHAFGGGWIFWKEARLEIVKETNDGIVDVAIGFVRNVIAKVNYDRWRAV